MGSLGVKPDENPFQWFTLFAEASSLHLATFLAQSSDEHGIVLEKNSGVVICN